MNGFNQATTAAEEIKKAISSGCRMLAIREHSVKQISIKLGKKGFTQRAVLRSIEYFIDENWLSESRFCNSYIRSKASKGLGLKRIERELAQHGIAQSMIVDEINKENIDWQRICNETLLKKQRYSSSRLNIGSQLENDFDGSKKVSREDKHQISLKEKIKLEKFLIYRGFSNEQIRTAINQHIVIEH